MAQDNLSSDRRPGLRKQTERSTVDARNNFADVLNRAAYGKEHVILTRRGKAVAALIPVEDLPLPPESAGTNQIQLDIDDD